MSDGRLENQLLGWSLRVRGTVQGVGFRPSVYKLARELGIVGTVINDGEGVLIHAWGQSDKLTSFLDALYTQSPPLAHIESIEKSELAVAPLSNHFEICKSEEPTCVRTAIPADAATCTACVDEVLNPHNRRFRYPFTNCTDCGPRLSIIEAVPYDRAKTSMSSFQMCNECRNEYDNEADRRFHAQPNACPNCGPRLELIRFDGMPVRFDGYDELDAVATLIMNGEIVIIKGIGGFHIACAATEEIAVARLRAQKKRHEKPFAMMARNLEAISRFCEISELEKELLTSSAAPIVVLRRKSDSSSQSRPLAPAVAPNQSTLGFMLPYTPLHHLLMSKLDVPIVLTSGNISDEPQCISYEQCRQRLRPITAFVLRHDREIVNRQDDSVVKTVNGQATFLRRARGYAPTQIELPPGFENAPEILAMGGELKNTFCLSKDGKAIVSQHLGDLEEANTFIDFKKNVRLYEGLYQHRAARIAIDLHPEYISSKLGRSEAQQRGIRLDSIQHHHAHLASCMADNRYPLDGAPILGIALDGLGYGADGTFWGGEFLLTSYRHCKRLATFKPVPMPGGSQAIREPWRNTYAHITAAMGWSAFKAEFGELNLAMYLESKPLATLDAMLRTKSYAPLASSCGRLFDAVAAAAGICRDRSSYEGQAAVELEACLRQADWAGEDDCTAYPFSISSRTADGIPYIEPLPMWKTLLQDLSNNTERSTISARFHKGLAESIAEMASYLSVNSGEPAIRTVALSGGVFQNQALLELLWSILAGRGFTVLTHKQLPCNDGGLSFGQAIISAAVALAEG